MRFKFLLLLFLGFLSSYFGEIKAEEICYYSSPKEYENCSNDNSLVITPKYPFLIKGGGGNNKYRLIRESDKRSYCLGMPGTNLKRRHLGSNSGKELVFKKGIWKRFTNKDIRVLEEKVIPNNKILSWTKEDINCYGDTTHNLYSVNYLDENFNLKQIVFRNGNYRTSEETLISELLENLSGMKKNDKREENYTDKLIYEKIKDIDKRLFILKSVIGKSGKKDDNCFKVESTKFPELNKEYAQLFKTINPLRAKLDLPPTSDLKPICN